MRIQRGVDILAMIYIYVIGLSVSEIVILKYFDRWRRLWFPTPTIYYTTIIARTHAYRFELLKSSVWPFLRHMMVGSGDPLGGPHSISAVSPCATLIFCGSNRNSSRNTAKTQIKTWLVICIGIYIVWNGYGTDKSNNMRWQRWQRHACRPDIYNRTYLFTNDK